MAFLKSQDGSPGYHPFNSVHLGLRCPRIWDPVNARFEHCALLFVSAIPAAVAACILLFLLLRPLLRGRHTPLWTRNIIKEPLELQGEPSAPRKMYLTYHTINLLVISILGCMFSTFVVIHRHAQLQMVFPAASWAFAAILILIYRPQSTPRALLTLFTSIFISQALVLTDTATKLRSEDVPVLLGILLSFSAITTILNMPLRDPRLPSQEISPVFGPPGFGLRSPEDNLTLWQYMTVSWMSPLITLGKSRQLHDEDVWNLAYEFSHRLLLDRFRELHGSILRRLLEANGLDLILVSIFSTIEVCANLAAPVFLQKILQAMENPKAPRSAALTYATMSLVVRLIAAQSSVFNLWYSRRCYERSRGELITMLYEKTLSRKVVSISTKARAAENGDVSGNGHSKPISRLESALSRLATPFRMCWGRSKRAKPTDEVELATMGKILNLMRFDAYEVAQRFLEASSVTAQPFGLILSVILIWRLIGWPCLIGVVTIFIAQGINALIARVLLRWETERRIATDKKLHKISQLVESIRHLRWYGWQDIWLARIMEARQHELALRVITALWASMISFVNIFASGMFPVAAFYAYTVLAGLPLRVDIAFPALQLFGMLENTLLELPNLITAFLNAKVAMGRIEEFMMEPDKLDAEISSISDASLEMKDASFAWPGASKPVLRNITLSFPPGLTVVCGEVGSGKTALLQALLGEADLLQGEYHRSSEMVGYCAQTPWLQSMSIRENILFSSPYDEVRYKQVLEACALIPDMVNFKNGDLSMVGENGVGLSGGQKARLALARAVYSRSRILFLDDPLSALDHQTAETIVRKCLIGPLMDGRTIILVTHRTELCLDYANQVIEVKNGQSFVLDPDSITTADLTRVRSNESTEAGEKDDEEQSNAIPEKFMDDEHRAHGGVMASVYWEYVKASKLKWWFILIIAMVLYRTIDIGEAWFVKLWGEAYGRTVELLTTKPFWDLPNPEKDVKPWLIGFFVIATAQAIAFLIAQCIMLVIIYKAGKALFERVMTKCTYATFRFYDVTPVGRLMNRLTSDINTVDGNISSKFQMVVRQGIVWTASLVVIASIAPLFLVFAIALTIAFVVTFSHFLPTSQSLRRLEMVSLSPLISNFGALADGLTTVRAFCVQYRFQERVIAVTDNFQKMDHFYWSLQAWLQYRFDVLSACSTFALTSLAVFTGVSPGLTAFVLAAANRFVTATHTLCRTYGQLQMDFVSVERIVELLHLDQEPPGSIEPPAYWPTLGGDIIFEDVTIQYAPHLDPAISNVSLKIKGGSTTALIGRTGSGKSTLALSLLATTLPTSGRILIDNIDISTVNTQALRKRVTFLAQEPVLFPGTMRVNLDPLDEYTDGECSTVLSKIAERHNWTLDTHIDTGGKNLSQGQRQLVGLARALLRRSAIVIMDEATASIDKETAMRIQEILRDEMKESTVITIAHRVEAVRNADFCVELGKGRVVEVGEPGNMISGMEVEFVGETI